MSRLWNGQDVPHLFDCVAHPNDLSPVNLWDKPIETIRELSFLDPGNLRMVEEGIQQQPCIVFHYVLVFRLWSHGLRSFQISVLFVLMRVEISLFNSGILGSFGVFCLSSFCVLFCSVWVVVGVCQCSESCLLVCVTCLLGKVCW